MAFSIKQKYIFFLELSCFFDDPADVGNLISGSSAFSKTSLNIMWIETNRTTHIKTYYKVSIDISTLHFFIPSKIVFYFVILLLYIDIHYYKCLKILKEQLNSSSHTIVHYIMWGTKTNTYCLPCEDLLFASSRITHVSRNHIISLTSAMKIVLETGEGDKLFWFPPQRYLLFIIIYKITIDYI